MCSYVLSQSTKTLPPTPHAGRCEVAGLAEGPTADGVTRCYRVGKLNDDVASWGDARAACQVDHHATHAADLATGDLSRLDVIVTGVRAYKDRRDLISGNRRLLDRVAEGCLSSWARK